MLLDTKLELGNVCSSWNRKTYGICLTRIPSVLCNNGHQKIDGSAQKFSVGGLTGLKAQLAARVRRNPHELPRSSHGKHNLLSQQGLSTFREVTSMVQVSNTYSGFVEKQRIISVRQSLTATVGAGKHRQFSVFLVNSKLICVSRAWEKEWLSLRLLRVVVCSSSERRAFIEHGQKYV